MKHMLQSLRTEHGAYSEIFIRSPWGKRHRAPDASTGLAYCSTAARPRIVSAINAKRALGLERFRMPSMRCSRSGGLQ